MSLLNFFFSLLVVTFMSIHKTNAVVFAVTNKVPNTPGGIRFTNEVGNEYSKQTLATATDFTWRLFQQNSVAERKTNPKLSLFIVTMDGVAHSSNDEISFSANYIAGFNGDVKREVTGVLYHEVTHTWQYNGNGQTPGGLIEGIADFVRLKAGYVSNYYVKPGAGDRWDQGYTVTARFLDYCNDLSNGFVARLNKKMATGYSPNYFVELLGKTADELWRDYKAKYNMSK